MLYDVYSGTLAEGANEISISNLYSFDWNTLGGVEYVQFFIGEQGDSARTIYFGDVTLSTVQF